MDLKKIEKLTELMKKNKIIELELEEENSKIKLKAQSKHTNIDQSLLTNLINTANITSGSRGPASPPVSKEAPKALENAPSSSKSISEDKLIRSPFVGTFYEAPAPDAEKFVKVGQKVRKGDTLCIIEAMKIMNEIEAERDCVIKEVLVHNEQPVEYDQAIFVIE